MSPYTVTMEVTVFVEAESSAEAAANAMEAIFDGDKIVCGNAEINLNDAKVQQGIHYTINH